jgi:hypothetical protein
MVYGDGKAVKLKPKKAARQPEGQMYLHRCNIPSEMPQIGMIPKVLEAAFRKCTQTKAAPRSDYGLPVQTASASGGCLATANSLVTTVSTPILSIPP